MRVEFLILPNGKKPAEEFFEALDDSALAKIHKLFEVWQSGERLFFPHVKKLEGYKHLWELRVSSRVGAIRVFYVYGSHDNVILISGFIKKSQKTPWRELAKAASYLKQMGVEV